MKPNKSTPFRSHASSVAASLSLALLGTFTASNSYAVEFWVGGATSSWGTAGNWEDGTATFGSNVDTEFSAATWTNGNTYLGGNRILRRITYNDNWGAVSGRVRFNNNGGSSGTSTANDLTFRNTNGNATVTLTSGMTGSMVWGFASGNVVSGDIVLNSTNGGLVFAVQGTGSLTINTLIRGNAGDVIRNGAGSGVVTFGPYASTYAGNTRIDEGKLRAIVGGSCANSQLILNGAAATFGVRINNNTNSWTCNSLTAAAAGTLEFDFGAVAPSDTISPLIVTNAADFTAATPEVSVSVDAGLAVGTYPLLTWGSTSGTPPTEVAISALAVDTAASLSVSGGTLNLVIAATAPSIVKADNTINLDTGTSWVGGVAPASTAVAKWDGTVTSPNTTFLGSDVTWAGITIVDPTGLVTIDAGNTLTLGAEITDINMSAATADLTLNCPLIMGGTNVWDVNVGQILTLGGGVSGAFPITKQGDGTAILSTTNTYTGDTTVTAGTLQLGAADVIPNGSSIGNVTVNGTLDLNTFSEGINGLSGSGIVDTIAGGTPTFTVGQNGQTSTFSGVLQNTAGTLSLAKIGTGTLTLGGANTLSGSVSITGGTLSLDNIAPLDSVTGITMGDGTTLRSNVDGAVINAPITVGAVGTTATIHASTFDGAGTTAVPFTLGGSISGDGNLTLSGVEATNSYGFIILNAASDYTGSTLMTTESGFAGGPPNNANIFVRSGIDNALPVTTVLTLDGGDGGGTGGRYCELNLNGKNQTLAGLTNVTRDARSQEVYNTNATASTLTINNTDDFIYAGKIGGQYGLNGTAGDNLGLTKSGAGVFTLSGNNTYTGATTITGGTLALGASTALTGSSAVSLGAATLDVGAAISATTTGTLDCTGAAIINLGDATSAIAFADSSALTWTGALNITGTFVSGASLRFGDGTGDGLSVAQLAQITASGFTGFGLDASGYLTATGAGGFASWITGTFANGTVTNQGPDDDDDNDGISNLVEYAVAGQDPTVANSNISTFTGGTLSFTKAAGTSGLTYAIQESTDLGIADDWTEVTGGSYVNDGTTISYSLTPGAPVKNFTRLQVISN